MPFLTKVANFLTILMLGYETNNVLESKSENNNEIILKTDEIFAKRVDRDTNLDDNNFIFHNIYIVIVSIVILLILAIKLYKKCVKDLSSAVITA